MGARYTDIQYGLLTTGTGYYLGEDRPDSASICKMIPYVRSIDINNAVNFPRLLIIEITGQSILDKDKIPLEEIYLLYSNRYKNNLKTIININSWVIENSVCIGEIDVILELIKLGIKPEHIIYLYSDFVRTNNSYTVFEHLEKLVGQHNINIISFIFHELHAYYRVYISQEQPVVVFSKNRPQKCLILTNKLRTHRALLLYQIYKKANLENYLISLAAPKLELDDFFNIKNIGLLHYNDSIEVQTMVRDDNFKKWVYSIPKSLHTFSKEDYDCDILDELKINCKTGYPFDTKLFENSCVELNQETYLIGSFFSEKTWRPIINSMPFIINGGFYTYKYLEGMGYKTFGNIIDQSFENEGLDIKRIQLVYEQVEAFLKNYQHYLPEIEQIVTHNKNHHYKRSFDKFNEIRQTFIKISSNFFNL